MCVQAGGSGFGRSAALLATAAVALTVAGLWPAAASAAPAAPVAEVAAARDDVRPAGERARASAAERRVALRTLRRQSARLAARSRAGSRAECRRCSLGSRLLRRGARGNDVRWVQRMLTRAGLKVRVTGRYNLRTQRRVRIFQRRWGLDDDGIVGPLTVGALRRAWRGESPKPRTPPADRPPAPSADEPVADIPANYLEAYRNAAAADGLDWRLLATIGKMETDHGRARLPGVRSGINFAGCCAGPMQFCVVRSCGNTWGTHGVDGNGDGRVSVYDPNDAIPAASRYILVLRELVGSRTELLLAAYNAGPGNVRRHDGVPPFAETRSYVRRGMDYLRALPG